MKKKGGASNNVAKANNNVANNASNNSANNSGNNEQTGKNVIVGVLVLIGIVILCVGGYYLYKHLTSYKASEEKTKMLIPYIQDAKVERIIQSGSIPAPSQGNEFNMNFWIYISDYNYRKEHDKCILYRGSLVNEDAETNSLINSEPDKTYERCNPGVWLLSYVNTLRVVVGLETKYDDTKETCEHFSSMANSGLNKKELYDSLPPEFKETTSFEMFEEMTDGMTDEEMKTMVSEFPVASNTPDPVGTTEASQEAPVPTTSSMPTETSMPSVPEVPDEPNVEICDVENIPLQRWVNVNVSVHDNVIDIALDGHLVKSCILSGSPYISTEESLYISPKIGQTGASGGFNGYISNLQYTNKSLGLNKVYGIYKNGPTIKKGMFN